MLSERGIQAIKGAGVPGLIEDILKISRPLHARMVHWTDRDGNLTDTPMPYGPSGEVNCPNASLEIQLREYSVYMHCPERKSQNVFYWHFRTNRTLPSSLTTSLFRATLSAESLYSNIPMKGMPTYLW